MLDDVAEVLFRVTFRFVGEVMLRNFLVHGVFRPLGALYFAGLFLTGHGAGWRKLARRFPHRDSAKLLIVEYASGHLGKARFDDRLRFTVMKDGLGISGMGLLGWMAKPIMVPWDEIHGAPAPEKLRRSAPIVSLKLGQHGGLTLEHDLWRELSRARDGHAPSGF